MTEQEKRLYQKTKERFRRRGIENPADVIVALAKEVELYKGVDDNVCVVCGEIIPEGLQVCPNCEAQNGIPDKED